MEKLDTSVIVSSASHNGYGTLRSFHESIGWTVFGPPEIRDPRDAFVDDPLLDPLDLALCDGYLYVTSEFPFGSNHAAVSLRRYDVQNGAPAGAWCAENTPAFRRVEKPRGIAVTDYGILLICAQNCVLAVDVTTSGRAWLVAEDQHLAGQSLALCPDLLKRKQI